MNQIANNPQGNVGGFNPALVNGDYLLKYADLKKHGIAYYNDVGFYDEIEKIYGGSYEASKSDAIFHYEMGSVSTGATVLSVSGTAAEVTVTLDPTSVIGRAGVVGATAYYKSTLVVGQRVRVANGAVQAIVKTSDASSTSASGHTVVLKREDSSTFDLTTLAVGDAIIPLDNVQAKGGGMVDGTTQLYSLFQAQLQIFRNGISAMTGTDEAGFVYNVDDGKGNFSQYNKATAIAAILHKLDIAYAAMYSEGGSYTLDDGVHTAFKGMYKLAQDFGNTVNIPKNGIVLEDLYALTQYQVTEQGGDTLCLRSTLNLSNDIDLAMGDRFKNGAVVYNQMLLDFGFSGFDLGGVRLMKKYATESMHKFRGTLGLADKYNYSGIVYPMSEGHGVGTSKGIVTSGTLPTITWRYLTGSAPGNQNRRYRMVYKNIDNNGGFDTTQMNILSEQALQVTSPSKLQLILGS